MTATCSARYASRALCFRPFARTSLQYSARHQSSRALDGSGIADLLSKPSWSVEALHGAVETGKSTPSVAKQQLHHLLKLSALPLPKDEAEESEMIKMLEAQLGFVQAVQSVDTTGVEPLQSIRDETTASDQENEITAESLKEHIDRESSEGFSRRLARKDDPDAASDPQHYNPLSQAPRTLGPYVVVNTKGSKPGE